MKNTKTSMILNKRLKKKSFFLTLAIIVVIAHQNNFFENTFNLSRESLDHRLSKVYGNCDRHGYGFISAIRSQFNIDENILILNGDANLKSYELSKKSIWFNYQTNQAINENKLILINYSKGNKITKNEKIDFWFKGKNFNDFKLIHKKNNCYFLIK